MAQPGDIAQREDTGHRSGELTTLTLPGGVRAAVDTFLAGVDCALPGRIEGVYLTGSLALDDYQTGRSDVDLVAVTNSSLSPAEVSRLHRAHRGASAVHSGFTCIYVTWEQLAGAPARAGTVPLWTRGRLIPLGGAQELPIAWYTLHRYPRAVRGPECPAVFHDDRALRRWNFENLRMYWQPWMHRHRHVLGRGSYLLADEGILWCVPGVTRLHYTIATGDLTSKSGACRYALRSFAPRWHPLLEEVRAIREGRRRGRLNRPARAREAHAYARFVIDDAERLYRDQAGGAAERGERPDAEDEHDGTEHPR